MKHAYTYLARFYDRLMEADYKQWEAYLLFLFKNNKCVPQRILDLGCGTGNLTLPLAQRGYSLTGGDISAEMIAMAKSKAERKDIQIPFFVQDMRQLSLSGKPFDAIISACDSLNYLVTAKDLRRALRAVFQHLMPGGLFLFDLNSTYKLQEIYGESSYADLGTDFAYFWDNEYDQDSSICRMELTFFLKAEDGLYQKVTEEHYQKLWMPEEIHKIAEDVGFSFLACYDFLSLQPCSRSSERWQFVLKRAG